MLSIVFKKQWLDLQGRLWTYPLVAFCFLLADRGFAWCGVVGAFMALDLATQTAGDDVRHGTFEFIFTRAIDRRGYLRAKFWFGPPLLFGFVLLVAGLEAAGVRGLFWNLVMEPTSALEPATMIQRGAALSPGLVVLATSALVLLFGLVFTFVLTAESEATFVTLNVLGLIVFGAYAIAVVFAVPHFLGVPWQSPESLVAEPRFVWPAATALLVPAGLLYFASREFYARRTLPQAAARAESRFGAAGCVVLVILGILALLVLMYLLLGHTAMEPTMVGGEGG